MAPSRVAGGLAQSSSSSGIFFQGDGHSQAVANSHLYGNSSGSIPGTGRPNLGPASGDMNNAVLNSVANSGPSVGASSLVTDANSAFSGGGPCMQRSASINTESYVRLPASPLSFTSNNVSISGSTVVDGSSVVQQGNHQESSAQQQQQQQQQHGASSATSLPTSQTGQVSLPMGGRAPGSYIQEPNQSQVQKKPRLDIKQEDILQQQVLQQLMQRQDPMQMQARNPQLQSLLQQQRLRQQQQQIFQSLSPMQRVHLQQQQQLRQQQMQQQQQQQQQYQHMQPASIPVKRPYDDGVCARRMMQYLYHQRQRPAENTIAYWRKLVNEYYSPRAKKRWCLSRYDNVGHHALGVFPQAAMEAWCCDICHSTSGRGFEATFEVLPRLNEIKFGSGVIDELLFLDLPCERRLPSGMMMLDYGKAVQESLYDQLRVVREGQLRVVFTHELKILCWEFCATRHEELLPRRAIAPQVNQLLQVAQKCQSTIAESGPDGVSQQDLQASSNMVLAAGRQLAKSLELQSLNDLGFSKRYVRCLQISEVVSSMKDLIDFCQDKKSGPIESLKAYPQHNNSAAKLQMHEMEQLVSSNGLPADRNTLNKLMAMHSSTGINNAMNSSNSNNNNAHSVNRGAAAALTGSAQAALAISNYQNLLTRQNSMNSNSSSLHQHEPPSSSPSSFINNNPTPNPSSNIQGPGGFPSHHQHQQQQPQQRSSSSNNSLQQTHHQHGAQSSNPALEQQMMQQLLQEMSNNSSGKGGGAAHPTRSVSSNGGGGAPVASRSNSFKATAASTSDPSTAPPPAGNNNGGGYDSSNNNPKAEDDTSHQNLQDDLQDIAAEFSDSGFFDSDLAEYGL